MSNKITEALHNIIHKDLKQMKENFNIALTEKAVDKLEEKKQQIAASYFGKK